MLTGRWGITVSVLLGFSALAMGCKREEGASETPVASPSPSEELPAAGPPAETPPTEASAAPSAQPPAPQH